MNNTNAIQMIDIPLFVDFDQLSVNPEVITHEGVSTEQINDLVYIVNNLGFIKQKARFLASKSRTSMITYEDLYQEGLLAALQAVKTYDTSFGASMNTHICNYAKWAMLDLFRHNSSSIFGKCSEKVYAGWAACRDNPTIDNLMEEGLTYQQAVLAIDVFVLEGCSLDDCINKYDDGAYWALEQVEREAYPLDLEKYLTQREADALRLEYGYADEVETVFPSRKAHQYACSQAIMKLQATPGFEQYLDYLR